MQLTNINIEERMKHYHVPGLSITYISQGRKPVTENYGVLEVRTQQTVHDDAIFSACSISKFVTGMLVLKLTEQGLLDLDEDVNKRLVSWKVSNNAYTKKKSVTLRNLLSHQSGIKDPDHSFTELQVKTEIPTMVDLLEGKTPYCKERIEVTYEPESEFHYTDAGFCIIQQLIEDVTNKTFEQVVDEYLFTPLNMENSTFNPIGAQTNRALSCGHTKNGQVVDGNYPFYPYPAASGLWTTSFDLSQLVLELLNACKGQSKIGISAKHAKEMVTPQGGRPWTGLGVFLKGSDQELEISSLGWGVGFQCMLVAYPYLEEGVVILTNAELGMHQMEGIIGEIYQSLMA